jgi:hypothetical protein
MTTTLTIDKAAIVRRLKANVKKMVQLRQAADLLESSAFADTYLWTTAAIADGTARDVTHGCQIIADTLKTHTWTTVGSWYRCGKFMAEKDLQSDKTDRRVVRDLVTYREKIPRAVMLKLIDMLKKGRSSVEIKAQLRKSLPAVDLEVRAQNRAKRLGAAQNILTEEQTLQLEIRAVQLLAQAVYGHKVHIVLEDQAGKVMRTTREPCEKRQAK